MKKEAVAYTRVSSQGQKNTGSGLARQAETIKAFSKTSGYTIVKVYKESFTGTESSRPVFDGMVLDLLSNGVRTILIECLDRLARDLQVQMALLAMLASKKITLINCMTGADCTNPTDAATKLMIQMLGGFAEFDKTLLVEKLRRGRQAKREKTGSCEGRKPFGHYDNEKKTLARIRELYRKPQGKPRRGPSEIARILKAEKLVTRKGTDWCRQTVFQIIKYNGWHS